MKAAFCCNCGDIIAPFRNWRTIRDWRWCQCGHTGLRWTNGDRGLLEVTSFDGRTGLRVIGLNNSFLAGAAVNPPQDGDQWRDLHAESVAAVSEHYLFHQSRRACWAVLIRPGETGDVTFTEYEETLCPASSTDRAAQS